MHIVYTDAIKHLGAIFEDYIVINAKVQGTKEETQVIKQLLEEYYNGREE